MPTYDYHCAACGGFDALRSLSQRNEPAPCPSCEAASPRVFVSAPRLACTSPEQRRAHDTNERARHEPRRSRDVAEGSYARMRHPRAAAAAAAPASAAPRSRRPTAPRPSRPSGPG